MMKHVRSSLRAALGAVAALAIALGVVVVPAATPAAEAADLSAFDPGLIITDDIFYDSGSMTAAQAQSFLVSKRGSCKTTSTLTCIADYKASIPAKAADAQCAAVEKKSNQTAAAIIVAAAKACGISPKVLIVTLQKEQGLITNAKSSTAYNYAMGYACPDTPPGCNEKYKGFFNQMYSAAWQFAYYKNNPNNYQYRAGRTNTIKYHPNASCGTTQVYIRNQATAGLYIYTPYVPNSAALAAGYGTGNSCSSYGNRNFYNYFTDWFGNPANSLKNASFQNKTSNWTIGSGVSVTASATASKAHSGTRYLTASTSKAGATVQQTLSKKPKQGEVFEGSIWVRADSDTETATGALGVQALGGTTESAWTEFTAGPVWTDVTTLLAVERTGHDKVRLAVRLDSPGIKVRVDTAALYVSAVQHSRAALSVEQTAVKSGTNGGWVPSSANASAKNGYAVGPVHGKYYLKLSSKTATAYFEQRVPRVQKAGESYTLLAHVRSGTPGTEYTGRISLVGMGGTAETATTDFVVGSDEWTRIAVTLDVKNPSHQSLRIRLHLPQPGTFLLVDNVQLAPNLYVRDASFEKGTSAFNALPAGTTVAHVPNADFPTQGLEGLANDGRAAVKVTAGAGGYVRLDRNRVLGTGQSYTAGMWVRSANPGTETKVALVLEARNDAGVAENTANTVTVGSQWTYITVTHTVGQMGLTRLRTDLRVVDGGSVLVDGATVR